MQKIKTEEEAKAAGYIKSSGPWNPNHEPQAKSLMAEYKQLENKGVLMIPTFRSDCKQRYISLWVPKNSIKIPQNWEAWKLDKGVTNNIKVKKTRTRSAPKEITWHTTHSMSTT